MCLLQPAFLSSMILPMDNLESLLNNAQDMKHPVVMRPAVASSDPMASPLNSILQYVNKSKILFERSPHLLLCILSLIKALWNGNIQYMQILQILRSSENFWKNMSSPIKEMEDRCSSPAKSVDDDQISCLAYRCQCEAAIMEIIAHDIFLHKKGLHDELTEKQSTEPSNESKVTDGAKMTKVGTSHSYDILTSWCQSSTLVSCIMSYSSSGYPEEIIYRAK
ncbi:hypothetical protein Taro_026469, partial [Colocasia esculenta]|nr:hypothetical protein [Colocasia esculenta]